MPVCESEAPCVPVLDGDGVPDKDTVSAWLEDCERLNVGSWVREPVCDAETEEVRDCDAVPVSEDVPVELAVGEPLAVWLCVPVSVSLGEPDWLVVLVALPERVGDGVGDPLGVPEAEGVPVWLPVAVPLPVRDPDGVCVMLLVSVWLRVCVCDGDDVCVWLPVSVWVSVGEPDFEGV